MPKRTLAVILAAGLIAGVMAAPADAQRRKKKKPKPVPVEMDLWFNAEDGCTGELTLRLTEATEGSNCGRNPFYGAGWQVGEAAGLVEPYVFYATEGLPFLLDATKPIVATVQVSAFASHPATGAGSGIGQSTLVGTLTGESGDETVELGTVENTYMVTPAQNVYEVVLEFDPVEDLDRATFTQFEISLEQRGMSVSHGHYRTVDPASKITVPTIVMKRR